MSATDGAGYDAVNGLLALLFFLQGLTVAVVADEDHDNPDGKSDEKQA